MTLFALYLRPIDVIVVMGVFDFVGKVVFPLIGNENFVSPIGHLDSRRDLNDVDLSDFASGVIDAWRKGLHKPLLDLCMMASKLAYENKLALKSTVIFNWKARLIATSLSFT